MNIKANRVTGFDTCINPGDYYFIHNTHLTQEYRSLVYMCPTGCGVLGNLPLMPYDNHSFWNWNGNEDSPTLTPSIQKLDGCKWHGFLTNGEWTTA